MYKIECDTCGRTAGPDEIAGWMGFEEMSSHLETCDDEEYEPVGKDIESLHFCSWDCVLDYAREVVKARRSLPSCKNWLNLTSGFYNIGKVLTGNDEENSYTVIVEKDVQAENPSEAVKKAIAEIEDELEEETLHLEVVRKEDHVLEE